jgi:hypothetical protein
MGVAIDDACCGASNTDRGSITTGQDGNSTADTSFSGHTYIWRVSVHQERDNTSVLQLINFFTLEELLRRVHSP